VAASGAEISVTLGGTAAIVVLAWYFFGHKEAEAARLKGSVQARSEGR